MAAVEAAGTGFLPASRRGRRSCSKGTRSIASPAGGTKQAPNLSHPKWDRSKYSGSLAGEWQRLEAACNLDRPAALQAASWGLFQIMGFNYAYCGCADVEAFVATQHAGADEQLACFARFISRPPYLPALRAKHWAEIRQGLQRPGAREEPVRREDRRGLRPVRRRAGRSSEGAASVAR